MFGLCTDVFELTFKVKTLTCNTKEVSILKGSKYLFSQENDLGCMKNAHSELPMTLKTTITKVAL